MTFLVASWHRCFWLSSLSWVYSVASLLGVEITWREKRTDHGCFYICEEKGVKALTINLLDPLKASRNSWRAALSFSLASLPLFFPFFPFFFFFSSDFFVASPVFVPAGSLGSSSAVGSRLRRDGKT